MKEELFVPNPNFEVFREDGKIKIFQRKPKKLYKEIKDRYPSENQAFALTKLLKKFPILIKSSELVFQLRKIASNLEIYNNAVSDEIYVLANTLEGGD